jgi:anthranilate phosphoribosyltransferase
MAPVMAEVFAARGSDVLLFRGDDGLDEMTTTTTSTVWEVRGGKVRQVTFDPADVDIERASPAELRGGDVRHNVSVARHLFAGKDGSVRDAVVLNAAAGLAAHAGLSGDLVADLRVGVQRARAALDSGSTADVLDLWVKAGQRLAPPP